MINTSPVGQRGNQYLSQAALYNFFEKITSYFAPSELNWPWFFELRFRNKVLRAEVRRQTGDFDYSVFPSPATAEVVNYAHLVENAPAVVLSNPATGGSSSYNEVSESEANNLANGRTPVATPVRNEVATLEENRDHRSATGTCKKFQSIFE